MNLRWLLGNFTDPQYKLSRKEQFRLSNLAHQRYVSSFDFLGRTFVIVMPLAAIFALLNPFLAWLGYRGSNLAYVLAVLGLVVLLWPWSAWMYRSLYVVPIRKAMRDAGYVLCLNCGYDLRNLPDDVKHCPECGEVREAIINQEMSHQRASDA